MACIAILITILVLELRPPEGDHLADILHEKSKLLAYMLSFVMVGIYWNNHHHLFQVVQASTAARCGRTCTCSSGSRSCRWGRPGSASRA